MKDTLSIADINDFRLLEFIFVRAKRDTDFGFQTLLVATITLWNKHHQHKRNQLQLIDNLEITYKHTYKN